MKLYLDVHSGISGDMTVATLLDLGASREVLLQVLEQIPVEGFRIQISQVRKGDVEACDFAVVLGQENHDHDMEFLHGHRIEIQAGLAENGHGQQRNLEDVLAIIGRTPMSQRAREYACSIFRVLAEAEAKAHGVTLSEVHFHEVGAVDSIVDVIAAAVCLDNLNVDEVLVSPLAEGYGTVRCQHGLLSVPVPAVSNIAETFSLDLNPIPVEGELVTPTGAAFVAACGRMGALPAAYRMVATGYGAGKRKYPGARGYLTGMLIEE